jgi:hypothetical protein
MQSAKTFVSTARNHINCTVNRADPPSSTYQRVQFQ